MISKMTDKDYFSHPAISNSGLKLISKSPAHFKANYREESKALTMGSFIHCAVLEESKELSKRYACMSEGMDRRTKEGKAMYQAFVDAGKVVMNHDEFQEGILIAESVLTHETASKLLVDGYSEIAIFTEIDGVQVKCKVDYLRTNGLIIDLKTTDDASPQGFAKSVASYGYHRQAAWYMDCAETEGINNPVFIFIAVEKKPPYAVGIYQLDDDSIEKGRELNQKALDIYRHCLLHDDWPGYDPSILTLSLPAWAFAQ